ncbi:hypothetical protein OKA05_24915 [Luteolibacter arcticus]|uniref:Uncharacterized protein n=1 Tax=Luteolibacter arcticus TaxID=1581411 RepID=A0ABT3GQR4_9BACT|nr:hypothetical protein [Luteolibacter arcticus]MCW1925824.1 hypothetical protein [Luteolibacter arcticus]
MRPDLENPRDSLPPNRAIGWYRFVLWLMPTCVAITAAIGLAWLLGVDKLAIVLWLIVTVGSTVAIGMFEARLQVASGRIGAEDQSAAILRFALLQVVLVPVLILGIVLLLLVTGDFVIPC